MDGFWRSTILGPCASCRGEEGHAPGKGVRLRRSLPDVAADERTPVSKQSRSIARVADGPMDVMARRGGMRREPLGQGSAMGVVDIQAAARALGVSSRTLRHYEDKGLVRSHRLVSNVRGYDAPALERLHAVVELRALGLSLAAIAGFLTLSDAPEAQAKAVHAALSEALARQQARLSRLAGVLQSMGESERGLPFALSGLGQAPCGPP